MKQRLNNMENLGIVLKKKRGGGLVKADLEVLISFSSRTEDASLRVLGGLPRPSYI